MKTSIKPLAALATGALVVGALVYVASTSTLDIRWAAVIFLCGVPLVLFAPAVVAQARDAWNGLLPRLQWWHACWFMSFASGMTFRSRDTNAIREMPIDFWAGYRVALVVLVLLLIVSRTNASRLVGSLSGGVVGLMSLYACMSIMSTLWSVYPLWTAYRSCEYLIDVAVVAAILACPLSIMDVKSIVDITWTIFGCLLGTIWLGVVIWPQEALQTGIGPLGVQIQGVFPAISSNGIGDMAGWLTIIAVVRLLVPARPHRRRLLYALLLAVSLLSLGIAQTRSALIGTLAGVAVVLTISRQLGLLALLALCTTFAVAMTDAPAAVINYLMRDQNMDLVMSLSGRVDWWAVAWEKFLESPWLGHGAYAGGRFATLEAMGKTSTSSVHNTYLEVLLGTGILGLIPLLLALVRIWSTLLRSARRPVQSLLEKMLTMEALGITTILMIRAFFSVGIIWHTAMDFFVVLIYCEFLLRAQPVPSYALAHWATPQPVHSRYS